MTADRPLSPGRAALIERAAIAYADRPCSRTPIPDLIAEFELSVSEACSALRRAEQMRTLRKAFA